LLATKLDGSRVLGLVSFDCHPGSSFFLTSEMQFVIARLCLLLPTALALSLSPQKATPGPTTTFPLSLLRRSLARSVCSDMPTGLSHSPLPATSALRIALNFSPQKAGAAAGRPTACSMAKGASRCRPHRPPCCHHGRAAALDPPPRGCARLIESHHEGGN
jgi:hypothetical protein